MDVNLEKWYKHNYLEYGDNVARMANYLSIKLRIPEKNFYKQLSKLKYDRIKKRNKRIRMNKILYKPASRWFRYLESQMFKGW